MLQGMNFFEIFPNIINIETISKYFYNNLDGKNWLYE